MTPSPTHRHKTSTMAETTADDLPEALLLHILSFLPTIDAVRSSSVSRKWRNLWHHILSLNFDMRLYPSPSTSRSQSRIFFSDFITQALFHRPHPAPLHSFLLVFDYVHSQRSQIQVDSWIRRAVASGASVLDLTLDKNMEAFDEKEEDNFDDGTDSEYEFHFSDLKSSSVEDLKLVTCRIIWPQRISGDLFSSLHSICLEIVSIHEDEFFSMVSSCGNLEALFLCDLYLLQNVKIRSNKLRELRIWNMDMRSFEIFAPSLRTIDMDCFSVENCCFKDSSSIFEAFVWGERDKIVSWCGVVRFLSGCERLKMENLCLNHDEMRRLVFKNKDCHIYQNLKFLELNSRYREDELVGIASFLALCPALEELVIGCSYEWDFHPCQEFKREPKTLVFHMPSLKQVKMMNYRGKEAELHFVELLKLHQVVLECIVAFPKNVGEKLFPPVVLYVP